jgi:acetyltransferase-like isoleucine patch superfamily enzyme
VINLKKGAKINVSKQGKLFMGLGISLPAKMVLDIYENGILEIDGNVNINKGCKIMIGSHAKLSIGNGSYINENSRVQCRKEIVIGSMCAIAWNVDILDTDEHIILENNTQINPFEKTIIGNNVWIGLKTTILKGSIIEDNCIIGAASLVKGLCKSNNLYAGVPCKLVRENITWKK